MFTLKNIISVLKTNQKPLKELKYLLDKYNSNDWEKYQKFSKMNYERNLIFRDKNYEIFLICWDYNQFSPIHNHADNGCLYKVIQGQLSEFKYDVNTLSLIESSNLNKNFVSYIDNDIAYHKIGNDLKEKAMSIHIYSPPDFTGINFKK